MSTPAARRERIPIYGRVATRDALMGTYEERLRLWPVPFESAMLPSRFGNTYVIITGERTAPPLLLLHPMGVASVVWSSIIATLSQQHRVYALDTIGDVGRSELRDPKTFPKKARHYNAWLDDTHEALELAETDIVAGSMGGWIALHRAIDAPARVRRLVLLGPMGLPSWRTTIATLGPMTAYRIRPTDARRERILDSALGDGERVNRELRPWMRLLATCRPKVGAPLTIPGRKLRRITTPTLVLLGAEDGLVGDANAVAKRARRHIDACEIEVLPDAGHAMSIDAPELVGSRIVRFLGKDI